MSTLHNRRRALTHAQLNSTAAGPVPGVDLTDAFTATFAYIIGYGVAGYGVEGAEADNPDDPGGFTWRGITLTNYRDWVGNPSATTTQLLRMTEDEILAFYGANYWNAVAAPALPGAIALVTTDFAVNAGPYRSGVTLQSALGFTGSDVDGSIGPQTLEAVATTASLSFLLGRFSQLRLAFYHGLNDPEFIQGWSNRVTSCEEAATALLPVVVPTPTPIKTS